MQVKPSKSCTLFLIGNKIDLLESDKQKNLSISLFEDEKKSGRAEDFFFISAREMKNIGSLLKSIRKVCSRYLDEGTLFQIPKVYKRVANKLKEMQTEGNFLLGT